MKSIADIKAIRDKMQAQIVLRDNQDAEQETRIVVGMATCGISAGARPVFNTLVDEVARSPMSISTPIRRGTSSLRTSSTATSAPNT